jgi:hypothetical protein
MMTLGIGALLALWLALPPCQPSHTGTDTDTDTDAGTDADTDTDAGTLSPHEREEAAKDELGRVREALGRGDLAEAAAALDRASEIDPSNPGVAELREQLLALQPDAG